MLLLRRGRFLEGAMRAERITRKEILAALRASGAAEPQAIAAVVLETGGSLSRIAHADTTTGVGTLDTVRRLDDARA
jgi:uncharacterized membrane protein YcaP (DUF421 family)